MDLGADFQAYIDQNTRRRNRAVIYFWGAVFLTVVFGGISVTLLSSKYLGYGVKLPEFEFPGLAELGQLNSAEAALNLAHFSLNLIVASMARSWYLRQDKLTALLTEALVLEEENETAIKLLLNQKVG